jgi:hypothetical protein
MSTRNLFTSIAAGALCLVLAAEKPALATPSAPVGAAGVQVQ